MTALRPELPPAPERIRRLPIDRRGYPVPWFVSWVDGEPDHRVMDSGKIGPALRDRRCWVCGDVLGKWSAYVIGPMCSVTLTSGEPPSHRDCAVWAAQACPHLSRPHARRRDAYPDGVEPPAGFGLTRNPGAAGVWITRHPPAARRAHDGNDGVLFTLPEASEVLWFCEGREATREEVDLSIASGIPILLDRARRASLAAGYPWDEDRARADLELAVEGVERLLPPA